MNVIFQSNLPKVPTAALIAIALVSTSAFGITYDLKSEWSDSSNSNGVWSYNDGSGAITNHVSDWLAGSAGPNVQPAWAETGELIPGHIVSWFKSTNDLLDYKINDIVVHTWDGFNGARTPPANLTWTSPADGTIDLTGSVWLARSIGRAVDWSISVRGTTITGGSLFDGDAYSRDSQFSFASGSGGDAVLNHIVISKNEIVRLTLNTSSASGEFVGVEFQVALNPVPEPKTYLLLATGLLAISIRRIMVNKS